LTMISVNSLEMQCRYCWSPISLLTVTARCGIAAICHKFTKKQCDPWGSPLGTTAFLVYSFLHEQTVFTKENKVDISTKNLYSSTISSLTVVKEIKAYQSLKNKG